MAILGIDYGSKKIGIAKSDENNRFAMPLEIIKNKKINEALARIKEICQNEEIEKIVIGLPMGFHSSAKPNQQLQDVLDFIEIVKGSIDLPVETEDERLSSKLANVLGKNQKKKGDDDAVAASLVLQTYLDKLER